MFNCSAFGVVSFFRRCFLLPFLTTATIPTTAAAVQFGGHVIRTNRAVTIIGEYPFRHVQVILKIYKSPAEVWTLRLEAQGEGEGEGRGGRTNNHLRRHACHHSLFSHTRSPPLLRFPSLTSTQVLLGFDIDSCCAGFDGQSVWVAERFQRALNKGYNLVNMTRRSLTYETRLRKYAKRGFCVAVPGLDKARVNTDLLNSDPKSMQGAFVCLFV